jgi:hypothetical protein
LAWGLWFARLSNLREGGGFIAVTIDEVLPFDQPHARRALVTSQLGR